MKTPIAPILHRDEYSRAIETEANAWFREAVVMPLEILLGEEALHDTSRDSAVAAALIAGTLWYHGGFFGGQLNAGVSRELRELGATLRSDGTFFLADWRLPIALRSSIAFAATRAQQMHARAASMTDAIRENVKRAVIGIGLGLLFNRIVIDLDRQATAENGRNRAVRVNVPILSPDAVEDFAAPLSLRLMAFASVALERLKRDILANAAKGGRPDLLRNIFRAWRSSGMRGVATISEHTAAQIVTAYRRELARKLGIHEYIWQTMQDNRVRHCHRLLNQKIFNWDNPPVIDDKTGLRGQPGEAANCRCVARLLFTHAENVA